MENQNQKIFETILSTEQSMVSDHKFQADYVVPAAVYFAMVREAFKEKKSSKGLEFFEITILHALIVEKDDPVSAFVQLEKDGGAYRFKVFSQKNNHNRVHVFGKVRESSFVQEDSLILKEISTRCQKVMCKQEFYNRYERSGIFYEQYYQMIKEVHTSPFEFMSVIERDNSGSKCFNYSSLSQLPSFIDGAIQSIGSIYRGDEKIIYVPSFIKRLRIIKNPDGKCYCYGTTYTDSSKNPQKLLYDLTVCDEKGVVIMELSHFEMKRFRERFSTETVNY